MTVEPILDIKQLTVRFPDKVVLDRLDFQLYPGEMISLIGANGAGKTTLIRAVLHQVKPVHGTIETHPLHETRQLKIGYVPQFRNIDHDFPLSIASFVGLNRLGHHWPFYTKQEHQNLKHALACTYLTDLAQTRLGSASGGEKQRAYLAQALVDDPDLLILDESTASLDVQAKNELMALVQELNHNEQLTVVFITHDLELAARYTTKYYLLEDGKLSSGASADLNQSLIREKVRGAI
ncbi:ATP-binding cassette domain-containing protein [Lactobacillus sp. CC-MHH1034]|uniref:metal ABC transporter ATP-binding protein n=1 Tax=Agrilactobacillus fermenti TaxID=2586909 RepID=UPI001E2B42EC|nr:ATP-binding cassette domain-containing protein [Agrilactobacillus fermenti]MCD2255475.1 ATP-binding cassette domain-containing protein [Agrilactobacillus fermenti]